MMVSKIDQNSVPSYRTIDQSEQEMFFKTFVGKTLPS